MFPDDVTLLAKQVVRALTERNMTIVTAESCTGGLIAGVLTEISGSSAAVYGGFVTYANEAKIEMIGVPMATLEAHGAVSTETARAMAEGALKASPAQIAIAVTGIAGPTGGSAEKPVGLVHFGCATPGNTMVREHRFDPDLGRGGIREATVREALRLVLEALSADQP